MNCQTEPYNSEVLKNCWLYAKADDQNESGSPLLSFTVESKGNIFFPLPNSHINETIKHFLRWLLSLYEKYTLKTLQQR